MLPPNSILDPADKALCDTIVGSNVFLLSGISAYFIDLYERQFGCAAAFAPIGCTVPDSVGLIRCCRIPPKVFKPVISVISVIVATLLAAWARTYECLQNECVRTHDALLVVLPKVNIWARVGASIANCLALDLAIARIADAALIGYFVKTLKTEDRAPFFHAFCPSRHLRMVPC